MTSIGDATSGNGLCRPGESSVWHGLPPDGPRRQTQTPQPVYTRSRTGERLLPADVPPHTGR